MAEDPSCIFCKIVKGELPSYNVYEDRSFIGILDIYPNIKGQTLVIPKRHVPSYVFDLSNIELAELMATTKKVAKLLERKLNVGRVHIVFEGTSVNHLHAKLYPAIGTSKLFRQAIAKENIYFTSYPGFVTTMMGPRADDKELEAVRRKISGKKNWIGSDRGVLKPRR